MDSIGRDMKPKNDKKTEELIEEAAYAYSANLPSHNNCWSCCDTDSKHENDFEAGAQWAITNLQSKYDELRADIEPLLSFIECECWREDEKDCNACETVEKFETKHGSGVE
jgi:hypothetical protein